MSQEDTQPSPQTLGAFLREHREKIHVSLEDATESTKISLPILRAIEEDDYDRMPAEAFCRGFYSMYAEFLQLNPEEILTRYLESRGQSDQLSQRQARPPIRKSKHFSNYAEPAAVSPATSLGMLLLICLFIIVGVGWYFNWIPTEYGGTQLSTAPAANSEILMTDSSVSASEPALNESPLEVPAIGPYRLEVDFLSSGTLSITLDGGSAIEKNFTSGETLQWEVKNTLFLDMPEGISATLRLNGVELPLPEAIDGRHHLVLPESSLD